MSRYGAQSISEGPLEFKITRVDCTYNTNRMTSKDTDQPVHQLSMTRVLVYPSLNSLEAVEGKCDQRLEKLIRGAG